MQRNEEYRNGKYVCKYDLKIDFNILFSTFFIKTKMVTAAMKLKDAYSLEEKL